MARGAPGRNPAYKLTDLGQFDNLSEVDAGVEAGLGLLMQRVLHRPRLELLLGPKRLLLVKHLAELGQVHSLSLSLKYLGTGKYYL